MTMLATLHRSGGIVALARQVGTTPALSSVGVEALLPRVMQGFASIGTAAGGGGPGLAAIVDMLDEFGAGSLAAEVMGHDHFDASAGEAILERILPGPSFRAMLIEEASAATGLAPGLLDKMMPVLAMLVGGYVSARAHGLDGVRPDEATLRERVGDIFPESGSGAREGSSDRV